MLTLQYSSTQAHSHGDNLIRNAPSLDSPIAQDSAGQSPGQVPDSNFIQHSGKIMAGRSSTFPRLFRELDRFPQDDLNNIPLSPVQSVQSQCSNDDLIEHARTELKEHEAAITKHLVKKAALEEKLKVWQLDSAVSNGIVDNDGCGGNPLQSGLAIEKRIRELKEASKQQDDAIQKHHIRRAALERRIDLWRPYTELDYGIAEATTEDTLISRRIEDYPSNTISVSARATCARGSSGPLSYGGDMTARLPSAPRSPSAASAGSWLVELATVAPSPKDGSIPAKVPNHHALDRPEFLNILSDGLAPINNQSTEYSYERKPSGDQATRTSTVQVQQPKHHGITSTQRHAPQPDPWGHKQGTGTAGLEMSYLHPPPREDPWTPWTAQIEPTGPKQERAAGDMSHLQRLPRIARGGDVSRSMDDMATNLSRMDINRQSTRKSEIEKK